LALPQCDDTLMGVVGNILIWMALLVPYLNYKKHQLLVARIKRSASCKHENRLAFTNNGGAETTKFKGWDAFERGGDGTRLIDSNLEQMVPVCSAASEPDGSRCDAAPGSNKGTSGTVQTPADRKTGQTKANARSHPALDKIWNNSLSSNKKTMVLTLGPSHTC
jgi:hypothetical protein